MLNLFLSLLIDSFEATRKENLEKSKSERKLKKSISQPNTGSGIEMSVLGAPDIEDSDDIITEIDEGEQKPTRSSDSKPVCYFFLKIYSFYF